MTDTLDTRSRKQTEVMPAGLANPLAMGLSIVAILAAIVLTLRSLVADDHRAHVWNVRLFSATLVLVVVLAVARVVARLLKGVPDASSVAPPSVSFDLSDRVGAARGMRRHRRVIPATRSTTLRTYDGRRMPARILNVSMGGVAVEAAITDVEFATIVEVGTRLAKPIRRTPTGAVFRFEQLLDPVEFDRGLVL